MGIELIIISRIENSLETFIAGHALTKWETFDFSINENAFGTNTNSKWKNRKNNKIKCERKKKHFNGIIELKTLIARWGHFKVFL